MATHTSYGSAQSKTTSTTLAVTITPSVPAGTLLVLAICCDNVAAATPTITSVSALGSDVWTARAGSVVQSGASTTAGTGVMVFCYTLFTTATVANNATVTITFSVTTLVRTAAISGFKGASNTLRNTVASAGSTTGVPSVATAGTALVPNDLVIGVYGVENNAVMTVDTDTLNGPWALGNSIATTGSTAATNCATGIQYKNVSAAGAQTFNPLGGAADAVAIVFAMAPSATAGFPKVYTGAAFVQKPLKVWNGSAWVQKPIKIWTGTAWRVLS